MRHLRALFLAQLAFFVTVMGSDHVAGADAEKALEKLRRAAPEGTLLVDTQIAVSPAEMKQILAYRSHGSLDSAAITIAEINFHFPVLLWREESISDAVDRIVFDTGLENRRVNFQNTLVNSLLHIASLLDAQGGSWFRSPPQRLTGLYKPAPGAQGPQQGFPLSRPVDAPSVARRRRGDVDGSAAGAALTHSRPDRSRVIALPLLAHVAVGEDAGEAEATAEVCAALNLDEEVYGETVLEAVRTQLALGTGRRGAKALVPLSPVPVDVTSGARGACAVGQDGKVECTSAAEGGAEETGAGATTAADGDLPRTTRGCGNAGFGSEAWLPPLAVRTDLGFLMASRGKTSFLEIGVLRGLFAELMMRNWPSIEQYVGVDPWKEQAHYLDSSGTPNFVQDINLDATRRRLGPFAARGTNVTLLRMTSMEAVPRIPDASFDLVYLDARHDFCAVAAELEVYWNKVSPGGIFAGDDFIDAATASYIGLGDWSKCEDGTSHGGAVAAAVQEFAGRHGLAVHVTYGSYAASAYQDTANRLPSWYIHKPSTGVE